MAEKTYPLLAASFGCRICIIGVQPRMSSLLLSLNVPIMSAWWSATASSRVRWILR